MKTTRLLVTLIALLGVWQGMFAENQAYAVLEGNNHDLLKFYYGENKPASGAYDIPWDPTNNPGWKDYNMYITKVVFDNSFSNYHGLSSTANMFYKLERLTTIEGISNLNTENVTDMSNMFSGCYILNSLDLSNFNTSNVTNMSGMFQDCRLLTSFDLSNFNTSNVTDMSNMFSGCNISLTSLDLSNFNTSSVTNMSGMFENCSALTEIIFSEANTTNVFNTSNVTDMSGMFAYCSALTSLDVSNFNTSSVTNMSRMFAECESLTSLDVSNFSTSSVTNMSQMFYRCLALTEILFSKANTTYVFNTSNVTDMSRMFTFCSALTSLDVSSFNTSSVTDMSYMFAECNSLTSLDVSKFNTKKVEFMYYMFYNCIGLTKLTISNENTDYVFNTESVTNMSYMFAGCIKLENIDISHFTTSNVEDMSNMFQTCKKLKNLDFSSFNTEKVTTMSNMFSKCQELDKLDLSNFNNSAVSSMDYMFKGCTGLETIDIRNFTKTENTSATQMFNDCENLKEIICLNTWDDSNSSQIFNGCSKLKGGNGTTYSNGSGTYAHPDGGPSNPGYFTDAKPYAILSNGTLTFYFDLQKSERVGQESTGFDFPTGNNAPDWTALEVASTITTVTFDVSFSYYFGLTSTKSLFSGLSNPTTINNLNYLHTDCVTNMSHMFDGCIGLTSLDLSNFSTNMVTDMSNMFSGCSGLTSLGITNFNTERVTDMSYMFSGCSSLTGLGLSNFSTNNVTDMSYMFSGCSSLTSLDLSELNTENVTDMSHMFEDCIGLTSLDLSGLNSPKVTDLSYMFAGCEDLESLVLPNFYSEDYNSAHLTYTSHLFDGCSSLTSIDVSKINTEYVTDMSYIFNGCSSLTSLDLNNFYIPNVTNLSYMFNGCSSLENIYCSYDWAQYGKVTSETSVNMFAGCENLPNFNSSQVTVAKANPYDGGYFSVPAMPYAYLKNHKLIFRYDDNWIIDPDNALVLQEDEQNCLGEIFGNDVTQVFFEPSFSDFMPTTTANWFDGMQNLESITGLEYLNTEAVSDMHSMFSYCYNLTSLDLTSFNVSNVTNMGNMFAYCSNLEMIYAGNWYDILYEKWNDNLYEKVYYSGMFAGCENLPGYNDFVETEADDIAWAKPKDNEGVGFFSTRQAYAIVIEEDDENLNLMFHYDGYYDYFADDEFDIFTIDQNARGTWKNATFTTVTFDPSFADYKLTSTAEMFSGLTGLTTINDLDNLNTSSITDMSDMFNGCTNLKTIYCGKDWSRLKVPSTGMFAGCENLPNFDPSQVTVAKAHPYDYGYFTKLPQAYAVQEGSVLTFYYDNGIDTHSDAITYEIPWFDYYPEWTGMGGDGYAPARRSAKAKTAYGPITRVVFNPSFAGYEELYYTTGMFYWMESLTSIEGLEYLNTENVIYMQDMFAGCSSLTSLNLTNFDVSSVESMYNMFYGCRNLGTIFCNEDWSETAVSLDEENGDGGMFDDCYSLKGRYGANYEDFMNDDEASSYISYARPDEADNSGFFTALLPDDILLYDSRSNTETINNSNGSVKVFLVDRTLYKTGDWNTLCLPFRLTAEQLAESPLAGYTELRTLSDAQYNAGTLTLNFTPATGDDAVTSIEAGKPYIIKWNSGENIVNPIFTNVSLANNSLKPVETDVVSFIGTYDPKPLTSANSNILYLGAGNTLYYPSANMTINAFRAYFELNLTSGQQVKAINLNFGDEESGIKTISESSDHSKSSDTYFSLDGLRLLEKPTQKGMYINNGRKVLIK